MLLSRSGTVLIMSSIAGWIGLPKASAYAPTKSALRSFAQSIRYDLAKYNIVVKLCSPGFVNTKAVKVNDFKMVDGNVFADIVFSASSSLGLTRIGAGIDHNLSLDETIIHFGDGLEYKFEGETTTGNISLTHYFGSIYLRGKFDTNGRSIAEIGFRVNL